MVITRYLILLSLVLTGCAAIAPLKIYPEKGKRVDSFFVTDAIENGATSCRYNLEDVVIHSLGDREWTGQALYARDAARRPFAGLYATKYPNGDGAHLQWIVGPDASGFCTVSWTEARYWNNTCSKVIAQHKRYADLDQQQLGDSIFLTRKTSTLRVLLTRIPRAGCLVTESDFAWRIEPDEKARDWIKEDHGYDPGEEIPTQQPESNNAGAG